MFVMALYVLMGIVLGVAALLVSIVCTPMKVHLTLSRDTDLQASVSVSPFGGHIRHIKVFDSIHKRPPKNKSKAHKKPIKYKGSNSRKTALFFRNVVAEIPRVIGQMIRKIQIDTLTIQGEFGLNDPAETGQLYGQLTPLIYGYGQNIAVQPNFCKACLKGQVDAYLRVIPVALLFPIARLLWLLAWARK